MGAPWHLTSQGVVLHLHIQPRASRDRVVGLHGEALKIALTAPPVEGAANAALFTFLATLLQVPRTSVSLVSGEKSREKRVLVRTIRPAQIIKQIEGSLQRVDKKKGDG
jgi:hypothetical protein